jgi:heme-degrading monooxygenase HmoA
MRVMGGPADRHPGLRQHLIGRDRDTGRLIGITVWDSEDDWNEAVQEGRAALGASEFDMEAILEDGAVFVLDVVDLVDPAGGVDSRGALPDG